METPQITKFEGWAVVEMFGHQKEIGYVTTQYFGSACLFQCDVPALPERELVLDRPSYADLHGKQVWAPVGSKVTRPASPGHTSLIGPSAIYKLTPCTEETALAAIDNFSPRPLILLDLAKQPQLPLAGWGQGEKNEEEHDDR